MQKTTRLLTLAVFTSFIFILLIFSLTSVYASVKINEVELNPFGSDSGLEWIELFNDGSAVNITNWYVIDKDGNNYSISSESIIEENSFFVLDSLDGLSNNDQNLTLIRSGNNQEQDSTGIFDDNDDNDETYSRNPDGSGSFIFQISSKGISNQFVEISDEASSLCNIQGKNVRLDVNISAFCINEVVFSVETDDGLMNFSGSSLNGEGYFVELNTSLINVSQSVDWFVYAQDCFNQTALSGLESFDINDKTQLIITPSEPDGGDGWYISEPSFMLINLNALEIFYRWDSQNTISYTGIFGLEDVPNNGNVSAGILDLNYWSDVSCTTEKINKKDLFIDLTDPIVKDLLPENNSKIFSKKPSIFAYIDELYQSNSGINKSSINLKLDGNEVDADVKNSGSLDVKVEYDVEENLSYGNHTIELFVKDNAGRSSLTAWNFEIVDPNLTIIVNGPNEELYNERRLNLNLSILGGEKALIQYINYNDVRPRFKRLCTRCSEYGESKSRSLFFNEGENNITIQAVGDISGAVVEENLRFFIDSQKPKISSILPRNNAFTNGSSFSVKYTENNLENVSLILGNTSITKEDCVSGRNQNCEFSVDLGETDLTQEYFYFQISDLFDSVMSRVSRVYLDSVVPEISVNLPENKTYIDRRVQLNISVSEPVRLEYLDITNNDPRQITRRLCSRCVEYGGSRVKTLTFRSGEHTLLVKATDKAGNSAVTEVHFSVV